MTRVSPRHALVAYTLVCLCVRPQEELPEPFEHLLQRIARRPKPQQFFGLMGKRDAGEMGSHPSLCLSEQSPSLPVAASQSSQSLLLFE